MARSEPSVSLYVPACNAAKTLGPCLRAIRSQTRPPDEIIVVDDGSADRTVAIARQAGARLIRHRRNRGVAAARNTAVRAARGDLVASLDADLVAPPDWLSRLLANFHGRRRIVGCCGQVIEKHTASVADRWRAVHMKLSFGQRRSYHPRWLYCGIALIRRDAMLDVGLFDERCRSAYEDVDLSDRLRAAGHTLLYDPGVTAVHLKRSTPGDVVRGFWAYWAGKNEMEGAYRSLATASRLMVRRQMGIARYRMFGDIKHRRFELLPLDLLIPLTFCLRDLEKMAELGRLHEGPRRAMSRRLMDGCAATCARRLPSPPPAGWVSLAARSEKDPRIARTCLSPAAAGYVRAFRRELDRLLRGLPARACRRVVDQFPGTLASG